MNLIVFSPEPTTTQLNRFARANGGDLIQNDDTAIFQWQGQNLRLVLDEGPSIPKVVEIQSPENTDELQAALEKAGFKFLAIES